MGGLDGPPIPPGLGHAPAEPGRASGTVRAAALIERVAATGEPVIA